MVTLYGSYIDYIKKGITEYFYVEEIDITCSPMDHGGDVTAEISVTVRNLENPVVINMENFYEWLATESRSEALNILIGLIERKIIEGIWVNKCVHIISV